MKVILRFFFGRAGPQPPFPNSKFHLRSRHPDTLLWNIMETAQTRFVNCSKTRQNGAQLLILVHIYTHRVHDGFICLTHFSLNAFTTIPIYLFDNHQNAFVMVKTAICAKKAEKRMCKNLISVQLIPECASALQQ